MNRYFAVQRPSVARLTCSGKIDDDEDYSRNLLLVKLDAEARATCQQALSGKAAQLDSNQRVIVSLRRVLPNPPLSSSGESSPFAGCTDSPRSDASTRFLCSRSTRSNSDPRLGSEIGEIACWRHTRWDDRWPTQRDDGSDVAANDESAGRTNGSEGDDESDAGNAAFSGSSMTSDNAETCSSFLRPYRIFQLCTSAETTAASHVASFLTMAHGRCWVPVTLDDGDPLTPHQRYKENIRFWVEQVATLDSKIEVQELELCELRGRLGCHPALQDFSKNTPWSSRVDTRTDTNNASGLSVRRKAAALTNDERVSS